MCRGVGYHCDDVETEEGLPTVHIDARDYPMAEAIQHVRELHKPAQSEGHDESCNQMDCQGCFYVEFCVECVELYPCPTIKALDGEQG